MHLSSAGPGAAGHFLFNNSGQGLLMHDLEVGDGLRFQLRDLGAPTAMRCRLDRTGEDGWGGYCTDERLSDTLALEFDVPRPDGEHSGEQEVRPRAREAGLEVGVLPIGAHNAITDVAGVRVGHATVRVGADIRTGVTAIVPGPGDLYESPVPAWIHTVNGYGKLIGETQVREFGEIETPILLTCTLCVWSAARGLAWSLLDGAAEQHTINPLVGETNDSWVNDMWQDPVQRAHVEEAIENATNGPVTEGSVGAGTGTGAFGWKGGIGTSSRLLPESLGGFTVGVLVQTNFGGNLAMNGAPVGRELDSYIYRDEVGDPQSPPANEESDGGSLMMVVATDAPLTPHLLRRLAERAMFGAARTGSFAHDSSGDYVIAFTTSEAVRRTRAGPGPAVSPPPLRHAQMSPLFAAVVEATEEAIYNAIFKATTVTGRGRIYEALPLQRTLEILERYGALNGTNRVPGEAR
jgi:D-aminopeptidase